MSHNKSQEVDFFLFKFAFLGVQSKSMFAEFLEYSDRVATAFFSGFSMWHDVIHVSFCLELFLNTIWFVHDVIHHILEGGWQVHKPEEHDCWFE